MVAHEENQKYKEGKYILERARMLDLYEESYASAIDTSSVAFDTCE